MITISILYPVSDRFDMRYYLDVHLVTLTHRLGHSLKGIRVEEGVGGMLEGTPPAFRVLTHMRFDSEPAFREAFAAVRDFLRDDLVRYTDASPQWQINRRCLSHAE